MRFRLLLALLLSGVCAVATGDASEVTKAELESLAVRAETELRENILPFWLAHARDRERGGFFGHIDENLVVQRDAPRGALLTARILWTFSAAYRRHRDPAYLEMARWAYDDLRARFWDAEHGGLIWRISADGRPLDTRKIVYVQAFGIYGLSEFHRATGEPAPLELAIELHRLLERHARDRAHRGYFEEFSRDWQVSRDRGRRGSAMGSQGQKSQNVHLHIFEAYTNLARVWPDPPLRQDLRELVDVVLERIVDPANRHLRLFLDEDWTPQSNTISFGHDIEFSWLITETAEVLGDEALLKRVQPLALEIARLTLAEGVDPDGGVLGEADPRGLTSTFKEWWPQAEAAVGFLNAYQISGDPALFAAARRSWSFIEEHLVDRVKGEWHHGVSRDLQRRSGTKVSFWKCPYHNSRACMELADRLRALAATR